jgi:hypothetical protein
MALFTDGKVASIEDLKDYESAVLQTAALEGIDLTAKLKLAQREIGFEISTFLSRHGYSSPGDITRVMVTDSLHHWLCLRTLELFYRDAYNSQVNDRYQGKWKEFGQLSRRAADTALDLGIGMVGVPVEKAADLHVSTEPGGILGPRSYYVSMTWLGTNGRTGERCDAVLQEVGASMLVRVAPPQAPANIAGWFVERRCARATNRSG